MFWPANSQHMTNGAFYKSRGHVLCSVRRTQIIPWFIVWFMLSLFAFGLIMLIKGADHLVSNPTFPAKIRLNKLVDDDSELGFW